jgi:uncharacterized protein
VSQIEHRLRAALMIAIKSGDAVAASALRSCLAAIDNAAAVPHHEDDAHATAIQTSPVGVGARDVPRLVLDDDAVADVVRHELAELAAAAHLYRQRGRASEADRLAGEIAAIRAALH